MLESRARVYRRIMEKKVRNEGQKRKSRKLKTAKGNNVKSRKKMARRG